ncbi:GSCOCG00002381001-RA-CDS [Cotesia congregata]|uniref:Uncharacterized protein n=1 Tax=Cotesia congregata TaxID=51543 RepID=A0A8J2MCB5_COTCN|nr:GSCOCG00002381001-RA-CDS [Cotesia congregata]CAG5080798.1 Protein of unknown function [Cotesia congregata]
MEKSVEIGRVSASDVSISQIFKSSFARSFVSNYHDNKILDMDYYNDRHDISTSSVDEYLDNLQTSLQGQVTINNTSGNASSPELDEHNLRKQCQVLSEENKRLQNALALQETSQIDSTYLQNQVDTLKWQLKQTESSRQMYRSLMKQVINFLERAQKSWDILHASNSTTGQRSKSTTRNSRSQIIYPEDLSINSSVHQRSVRSPSPTSTSKFNRAKSVAQISSAHSSGFRDFTWSVLRRNDPSQSQSSSPSASTASRSSKTADHRSYPPQPSFNKSDGTISKSTESNSVEKIESDHIPPEKLSQEAFRLLRTAESLLAMREPDLSFSSSSSSSRNSSSSLTASAVTGDDENTSASIIMDYTQSPDGSKSTNSINLDDFSRIEDCLSINEREPDNRLSSFHKSSMDMSTGSTSTLQPFSKSFDCASEEEEHHSISFSVNIQNNINSNDKNMSNIMNEVRQCTSTPNSTVNRRAKYNSPAAETKDQRDSRLKEKPTSISSAEDESGFSSMNSFQDVGLPQLTVRPATPVKPAGYHHSEVGLPDVPLDRINHRRWSSTPAEIQAMFRRYKNTYLSNQSSNAETLSVWV